MPKPDSQTNYARDECLKLDSQTNYVSDECLKLDSQTNYHGHFFWWMADTMTITPQCKQRMDAYF